MTTFAKGLEGIIAAETNMSWIDGTNGVLEYVGINIDELARNSTFEETVYLLWNKKLPTRAQLEEFTKELREHYKVADGIKDRIKSIPSTAEPMHVLRSLISELAFYDDNPNANDVESARHKAINILGQAPGIVAMYDRARRGLDPIEPDTSLTFSENFLYMLNGEKPTRDHGPRVRHLHDHPRRPRPQQLHLRRTRHHLDALRRLLRAHRGCRLAPWPAPRRRQRGRHEDAQRDPERRRRSRTT